MADDWRDYAACAGMDPELWFPITGKRMAAEAARPLQICDRCPVKADCLEWAITHRAIDGIWGGTTEDERRALIAEVRPAEPPATDVPSKVCTRCRVARPLSGFADGQARCLSCNEHIRGWERARRAQRPASA